MSEVSISGAAVVAWIIKGEHPSRDEIVYSEPASYERMNDGLYKPTEVRKVVFFDCKEET